MIREIIAHFPQGAAFVLGLALCGCTNEGTPKRTGSDRQPLHQDTETARIDDIGEVASARGWSFEEAERHIAVSEAIAAVSAEVARAYPEIFVGSEVSLEPGGTPRLYVKGLKWTPSVGPKAGWRKRDACSDFGIIKNTS